MSFPHSIRTGNPFRLFRLWKSFLKAPVLWLCIFVVPINAATLDAQISIAPGDEARIWSYQSSLAGDYIGIHVEDGPDVSATAMKVFSFNLLDFKSVDIKYSLAATDTIRDNFDESQLIWFTSSINSLTATLLSGMDYILSLECVGDCKALIKTQIAVSVVPLPAAVWLFASALIGFVLLSNRRSV